MPSPNGFLRVQGSIIVNEAAQEVCLKGAGLGGWMNMENFITGFPGCEFQIREALVKEIGKDRADFFFDKFLEYFFTEADAQFFKSIGLNCIRLPFNYRHFEDDMNPRVLKQSGFKHLDRVIEICARYEIYTILDMHTAPGGQNPGWHSDSGIHIPLFWMHRDFQTRSLWLWGELAKHYASNPWVAGYNPLNEPADPTNTRLIKWYDEVYDIIRAQDPNHIIFWDGNTFSVDFSYFGDVWKKWENCAYALHDYTMYGFPAFKGEYTSSPEQLKRLEEVLESKRQWMVERGLCVWNGEWGPVYARESVEGDRTEEINKSRFRVLKDQLSIYAKYNMSWSIWTYKDIGFQGMVYASPSSELMTLFEEFLKKKQRLAVDAWGADVTPVQDIYGPLESLISNSVEKEDDLELYPWKLGRRVGTLARNILVSDFLVAEWARHFTGKSLEELDRLAKSFHFENCSKRDELNSILRSSA